jgi:hypothetical protein
MRDAWDVSRPTSIVNQRGPRGAISLAEAGEVVLARAGKSPIRRVRQKARARVYSELNIVGSFPLEGKPWKSTAEILADMKLDRWFPADKELGIFANSKRPKKNSRFLKVGDAYAFMKAIYSFPAKRINLFTHGTTLSGKVIKGDVLFNPGKQFDLLGTWYYEATNPGFIFQAKKSWHTIKELRKVMPRGAILIIYGCKSGFQRGDLKRLSSLLGIVVEGFSHSILYHPVMSANRKKIIDWRYSHGKNGKKVDDYHNHELTPDISSKTTNKAG